MYRDIECQSPILGSRFAAEWKETINNIEVKYNIETAHRPLRINVDESFAGIFLLKQKNLYIE